jgi:hypothetical protein
LFERGTTAEDATNGDDLKCLLTVYGVGYRLIR